MLKLSKEHYKLWFCKKKALHPETTCFGNKAPIVTKVRTYPRINYNRKVDKLLNKTNNASNATEVVIYFKKVLKMSHKYF